TRVGNMPELVQHGVNGFFVEPKVGDIQAKLTRLRDDNALRLRMSQNIRQTIKAWDWNYQADNFRQLYHFVLNNQTSADPQQAITRLVRQLADFQSDFDNLRHQADSWEKRALEREAHLALIYQSTSWRLTRPLRFVGDLLRGRNPGWLAKILKRIR